MIFRYPPEVKKELEKLSFIEGRKMMGKAAWKANTGGRGAFLLFMWIIATIVVIYLGMTYGDSEGLVALIGVVLVLLFYCLSIHYFIFLRLIYPKFIDLINEGYT